MSTLLKTLVLCRNKELGGDFIMGELEFNELKKLFFSNLKEKELKERLNLNHKEYKSLLTRVKKSFGLSEMYVRKPHRYYKYNKLSYFLLEHDITTNDYIIVIYNPNKDFLKCYLKKLPTNPNIEYSIWEASDENLMWIVEQLYFNKRDNWSAIINKLKLPYYVFYHLLNKVKNKRKSNGVSDSARGDDRFIYKHPPTKKYMITRHRGNAKNIHYGYYEDKETARYIRDYLDSINWDKKLFDETKSNVLKEYDG